LPRWWTANRVASSAILRLEFGTGHVSPLLIDRDRIARLVTDFWHAHDGETEDTVAKREC
jgi:uncharacterized protein (DUF1786 family)